SSSLSSHDTPTTQIYTLSLHDALPIYNQYLFLEARPGSSDSNDVLPIEESVDELRKYVNHFVITVNDKLDEWKNRLLEMKKTNKDRKSTRLNSSHVKISYAVFCLKKKR